MQRAMNEVHSLHFNSHRRLASPRGKKNNEIKALSSAPSPEQGCICNPARLAILPPKNPSMKQIMLFLKSVGFSQLTILHIRSHPLLYAMMVVLSARQFVTPNDDVWGKENSIQVQGWTLWCALGSVSMRLKNCVLLPAAGRKTQFFLLIFTEPGAQHKVHPCTHTNPSRVMFHPPREWYPPRARLLTHKS